MPSDKLAILGVIPARYGSTRFPGKPLALINGRPMIEWVIRGASTSKLISKIVVATDDERIVSVVKKNGFEAQMTSDCPTGSDRVWEVSKDKPFDVVLNIQGDEPLIEGTILDQLCSPFLSDPSLDMATLGTPLKSAEVKNKNVAKIVVNSRGEAIYFSRLPVPSSMEETLDPDVTVKHIGIYAYRKSFLERFCAQGPVGLEKAERLEQLRALFLGARIKVVMVEHESVGVDTLEDISRVENILKSKNGKTKERPS